MVAGQNGKLNINAALHAVEVLKQELEPVTSQHLLMAATSV